MSHSSVVVMLGSSTAKKRPFCLWMYTNDTHLSKRSGRSLCVCLVGVSVCVFASVCQSACLWCNILSLHCLHSFAVMLAAYRGPSRSHSEKSPLHNGPTLVQCQVRIQDTRLCLCHDWRSANNNDHIKILLPIATASLASSPSPPWLCNSSDVWRVGAGCKTKQQHWISCLWQ